tara:strand:- start:5077 stop:6285 length:1209 start_codon:yes stop_codon:yes gene_type:complete
MTPPKISYAKTVYGKNEIRAVVNCLKKSTQMGKNTRNFEIKIAKLFKKKYCLFTNSGSSALYLALESLDFPKGSEVITPALTFSTSVGCLVKNSLIPSFVDVRENTYCIDVNKIEQMITKKTVAILAPNLMGNICEWDKISKIAKKYNLVTIEDSADTIGAKLNSKSTGYYSDISITSFYGSHIINCAGNGGALCLNNQKVKNKAKLLRSWGRSSSLYDENSEKIENRFNIKLDGIDYDKKFVFEEIGYNYEGSEIGAAFGLEQLKNLNTYIKARKENFKLQTSFFNSYNNYFTTPNENKRASTAWLAYPLLIKKNNKFTRKDFQIFLEKNNIQTRVVFTGNILRQPAFKNIKKRASKNGYPNSDNVMKNGLLLPVHHGMTKSMFKHFHKSIKKFIESRNLK